MTTEQQPSLQPINPEDEARVIGTWMARIGAIALVIGAAFAFKYAVDQGLIGPGARVIIGLFAGLALVSAGEWARKRTWDAWGQAVTAGALGLWYLSVWAAYQLYGLIEPTTALAGFSMITIAGVGLALRHDSEPLAILAIISSFMNPFLIGVLDAAPAFAYLVVIDCGVVILGTFKRWRSLDRLALILTWFAFAVIPPAGAAITVTFGALAFALFLFASTRDVFDRREADDPADAMFMVANSVAFVWFALLRVDSQVVQGMLSAALGATHLGLAVLARSRQASPAFPSALGVMGASLLALSAPLLFDGPAVPAVWTVQAVALMGAGRAFRSSRMVFAGIVYLAITIGETLALEIALVGGYEPQRVLISGISALLAIEVGALAAGSRLVADLEETSHLRGPLALGAHAMALLWLTLEVRAAVSPEFLPFYEPGAYDEVTRNLAFATTAVWAIYGAGALTAGVAFGSRLARFVGVGLIGVVVLKVVTIDFWLLDTLQRTIAFGGLGAMLLALSFLYNRFRELVVEGRIR
jgi:uncharacterized membrane protein